MKKEKTAERSGSRRKKISLKKAKELLLACHNEKTAKDIVYDQPYYCYLALRIAKEISVDVYGNDTHTFDFYNLFSALLGLMSDLCVPADVLKSFGFELVD